jgi:uncharacterized protein YkwD
MRRTVTTITASAMLALGLAACGATSQPLPQASPPSSSSSVAAPTPEDTPTEDAPAATVATTCDIAREAILTGSKAQIKAALKALQADKTADATAREYAQNYLVRDAGQPDFAEVDKDLIQMSCTL